MPPVLGLVGFFNNFNKHRMLNVIAAVPRQASVAIIHSPDHAMSSATVYRTGLISKTEIFSFTVEPPAPNLGYK